MSVASPTSNEELARVLFEASTAGRSVRVLGGGTRSRRGRPHRPDLTLSLADLVGVVDYEPADMTVTVRAGTPVTRLLEELGRSGQDWPHPDVRQGSTVGGVLATGSSGLARLRYGAIRDSLLEVVASTGDGRLIRAGARTVKSVAGYDLPRLLVGSDGTLGVILQATLRLWPRPAHLAWYREEGRLESLVEKASQWARDPRRPWSVVLVPGALWVQLADDGAAAAPAGMDDADPLGPSPPSGDGLVLVGVPPPALGAAVERLAADGRSYRAQAGVGSIEVAVQEQSDIEGVRALSTSLGGHAVVIDGPPALRTDPIGAPPTGVAVMRRLRDEFDPAGVLNVGCLAWEPGS